MVDTLQSVVGDMDGVEGVACTPTEGADAIRARFPSPEAYQRALGSTGYTDDRVRAAARDAIRIERS
mgnify:CR=1 FL=1